MDRLRKGEKYNRQGLTAGIQGGGEQDTKKVRPTLSLCLVLVHHSPWCRLAARQCASCRATRAEPGCSPHDRLRWTRSGRRSCWRWLRPRRSKVRAETAPDTSPYPPVGVAGSCCTAWLCISTRADSLLFTICGLVGCARRVGGADEQQGEQESGQDDEKAEQGGPTVAPFKSPRRTGRVQSSPTPPSVESMWCKRSMEHPLGRFYKYLLSLSVRDSVRDPTGMYRVVRGYTAVDPGW
jgi:hypothetical protein